MRVGDATYTFGQSLVISARQGTIGAMSSASSLSPGGDAPIDAIVVEERAWKQQTRQNPNSGLRYVVPKRFGLSAILGITTALSMLFGLLRWIDAFPIVYLFFGMLSFVICLVQMFFGTVPRMASTVAGAVLMPIFGATAMISFDRADVSEILCTFIGCIPFGALLGYITGTCAAGVFLVMDLLEPYLPGGGLKQPLAAQVVARKPVQPPAALPPIVMNTTEPPAADEPDPRVRPLGPPKNVPVFNCRVLVSPRNGEGVIVARAAEIAGIEGRGESEREALQQVVAAFKSLVAQFHQAGTPIPWLDPPHAKQPDDQERFIAVHL